jgi:hypothetical protein
MHNQATLAWLRALNALQRHGNYVSIEFTGDHVIHSVIESMGGWGRFGEMERRDEPMWRAEFERYYEALGEQGNHPPHLVGIIEQENAWRGYKGKVEIIKV